MYAGAVVAGHGPPWCWAHVVATPVGKPSKTTRPTFPDNRVTDHRVKVTVHQTQDVMDGGIDPFVDALLAAERASQLAGDGSGTVGAAGDDSDD